LIKQIFSAICTLLPLLSPAQENTVTLSGTLEVSTGEAFPYKIVITEANGMLKGYAYTYKEPNDTKTTITGYLDKKARTISFKETGIIYSGGFHTKAFMCLIDAHLAYMQGVRSNVLEGAITSREADKTTCAAGILTFSNEAEIQNLFSYHEKFDTVISMKKRVKDQPVIPVADKPVAPQPLPETDRITTGVVKTYDWHSDTVVLDIWDGGNVDGDRVTVQYNGKNYITNYFLVKEKKRLLIPVSSMGTDLLTIIAENEGSEPPNTATIMLTDGPLHYSIMAYNNKGDQAVIRIKKAKPSH
jgi:hypothetical protein